MASRSFSRAFRSPITRQLTAPSSQRRTFLAASKHARASIAAPLKSTASLSSQQARGIKTIDFAGTKETVYGMLRSHSWASRD